MIAFLIAALAAFIAIFLFVAFYAAIDAFVLKTLWAWFIVPIFHLPALALLPALGVSIVWGWLSFKAKDDMVDEKNKEKETAARFMNPLIRAVVTLGIGFVVHKLMVG